MTIVISKKNDMLDQLCQQFYGSVEPLEQVLEANPNLAKIGEQLPAGIPITLPAITAQTEHQPITLWD